MVGGGGGIFVLLLAVIGIVLGTCVGVWMVMSYPVIILSHLFISSPPHHIKYTKACEMGTGILSHLISSPSHHITSNTLRHLTYNLITITSHHTSNAHRHVSSHHMILSHHTTPNSQKHLKSQWLSHLITITSHTRRHGGWLWSRCDATGTCGGWQTRRKDK